MSVPRPPAYAWDWFARQRLLWREAQSRLGASASDAAPRYRAAATKSDVLVLLRADYLDDATVRDLVRNVVGDIAFLGRTDVPFERLGVRNPPRGLRWWWQTLTGEPVEPAAPRTPGDADRQLRLEDVHEGYGDRR